jgi:polysaccharide export outer membrane protein
MKFAMYWLSAWLNSLNNPQLDVNVVQYRSQRAYISGAVKNSGQLPITNVPLTLLDAVNSVGGYNENADIQRIKVTRNGQDLTVSLYDLMQHGDLSQNFLLKNGDVVYIPTNEQMKVHIMGEVTKQTTLRMDPVV